MLEVGNDEIIQAGQMARQQTPGARKIFNERIAEIAEAQPARMRNVIDDTLGTQGKKASVAKIRDEAYRQAEPLFNEVRSRGNLDPTYTAQSNAPTKGKLNAEQAEALLKQELGKIPTAEQLAAYPAESKFNPNNYTKEQAQNVLRNRAEKSGVELDGDITHYTKRSDRTKTVRTLSNTLESPDIMYSIGDKDYLVKKYDINGKPSFDFIAKESGKVKTKFPTTENYISNQLQKKPQNVSLSGRASGLRIGSTHDLRPVADNNISSLGALVKQNDVVADAIKKVKQSYSSLKKLPDTDANVLIEARKLLSEQSVSPNTTLAFQAKTVLWWP